MRAKIVLSTGTVLQVLDVDTEKGSVRVTGATRDVMTDEERAEATEIAKDILAEHA